MVTKKKDDPMALKVMELAKEIKKKVKAEFAKKQEDSKSQGIYPWEGMWLSPQDIRKVQEKMKERDKIVFVEIIILFIIFGFFSYILYRLMKMLLLP